MCVQVSGDERRKEENNFFHTFKYNEYIIMLFVVLNLYQFFSPSQNV